MSSSSSTTADYLNPPLSSSSLSVAGRAFIVTGGSQGLGLEICRTLVRNGASALVLVSRSVDKGQAACQELMMQQQQQQQQESSQSSSSCTCVFVQADMRDTESVLSVVSRAYEKIKMPISGLVNAAAITNRGNLFSTSSSEFDDQMNVNVRAPFLLTQSVSQHMREHNVRGGSIVNISSVAAKGGAPFIMAYSVSKAALSTLTKNNAAELAPYSIRVNAVEMGWTLTENEHKLQSKQSGEEWVEKADSTVPLGRILRPQDVASTVNFLLSDASSMMTGSIVSLHPEFADGMLSLAAEDSPER